MIDKEGQITNQHSDVCNIFNQYLATFGNDIGLPVQIYLNSPSYESYESIWKYHAAIVY